MVNVKVKYFTKEADLNAFLEQFNMQAQNDLPLLKKISYFANPGTIKDADALLAVVEYIDGIPEPEPEVEQDAGENPEVATETK